MGVPQRAGRSAPVDRAFSLPPRAPDGRFVAIPTARAGDVDLRAPEGQRNREHRRQRAGIDLDAEQRQAGDGVEHAAEPREGLVDPAPPHRGEGQHHRDGEAHPDRRRGETQVLPELRGDVVGVVADPVPPHQRLGGQHGRRHRVIPSARSSTVRMPR